MKFSVVNYMVNIGKSWLEIFCYVGFENLQFLKNRGHDQRHILSQNMIRISFVCPAEVFRLVMMANTSF